MLQSEKNQFLFLMTKVPNLGSSSSDQKKMCITKNRVGSPSKSGEWHVPNDIFGYIRYLWCEK